MTRLWLISIPHLATAATWGLQMSRKLRVEKAFLTILSSPNALPMISLGLGLLSLAVCQ